MNVTDQPVSRNHVQSIADHEIGTHLLRMINDEHQVTRGNPLGHYILDQVTNAPLAVPFFAILQYHCFAWSADGVSVIASS